VKRIEHVGTVVSIEGERAVVQLRVDASCRSGFTCACCSALRPEARKIRVERGDLEEGDTVRVSAPAYAGYLATLVVFILPLVLFVAGVVVGGRLEPSGGAHGTPTAIGGVLGLLLAARQGD
jgi:positive regulator of sigma E activity